MLIVRALPYWRGRLTAEASAFVLCATYVLATSVFGDYHLIVFWGCIFIYGMSFSSSKEIGDLTSLIVLSASVIMLVPKHYLFIYGYSVQVAINPLVLGISVLLVFLVAATRKRAVPAWPRA